MPFPESKRIIYEKNPLDKVVCQLKFPHILKIDTESPSDFQEKIRKDFPNFSETMKYDIRVTPAEKAAVSPDLLKQIIRLPGNRNYEFSSEDKKWKVNLTRNFLALTTSCYTRWEEFRSRVEHLFGALVEIYSPMNFSRIGLRYIDIIKRSILGLSNVGWNELLEPHLLGLLSSPEVGTDVHAFESKYEINLENNKGSVTIITRFVEAVDTSEVCYMIDSDFYTTEKTNVNNAIEILDYYHIIASRLIQWCITNRLHKAMNPKEI